jgi:hypothetical protein
LEHGARRRRLVSTHYVLELNVSAIALFGSQDRAADYRRVLVVGEVLQAKM